MFQQSKDENWKTGMSFLIGVLEYLNSLNVTLRGGGGLHKLYTAIQASKTKVVLKTS
jgi:hypothetical protein